MAAIPEVTVRLQLSPDVVTRDLDEGVLLVNLENGKTWKLNHVGATVCRGIEQGADLAAITAQVADRYAVDAAVVQRDIDTLIADLRREGLVEPRVGG